MADVGTELQTAIFAALNGAASIAAAAGVAVPIYDTVPSTARPPYGVIGGDHVQADAPFTDHSDTRCTVSFWAPRAPATIKAICGAAQKLLAPAQDPRNPAAAPPFTLPSHKLVTWVWRGAQFMPDPDGVSVKGVCIVDYLTSPTA